MKDLKVKITKGPMTRREMIANTLGGAALLAGQEVGLGLLTEEGGIFKRLCDLAESGYKSWEERTKRVNEEYAQKNIGKIIQYDTLGIDLGPPAGKNFRYNIDELINFNFIHLLKKENLDGNSSFCDKYRRMVFSANGIQINEGEKITDKHYERLGGIIERTGKFTLYTDANGVAFPSYVGGNDIKFRFFGK